MARKVSEHCALLHKTTQPAPYGTGCVMKTLSCCLREAILLLPPTPGTKTDQRHKPGAEQNHRCRQRHCRQGGYLTANHFPVPRPKYQAPPIEVGKA